MAQSVTVFHEMVQGETVKDFSAAMAEALTRLQGSGYVIRDVQYAIAPTGQLAAIIAKPWRLLTGLILYETFPR